MRKECCGTCEYRKTVGNGEWLCDNIDSDYFALETDYESYCLDYEEQPDNES